MHQFSQKKDFENTIKMSATLPVKSIISSVESKVETHVSIPKIIYIFNGVYLTYNATLQMITGKLRNLNR